jgi:hypothetical protein
MNKKNKKKKNGRRVGVSSTNHELVSLSLSFQKNQRMHHHLSSYTYPQAFFSLSLCRSIWGGVYSFFSTILIQLPLFFFFFYIYIDIRSSFVLIFPFIFGSSCFIPSLLRISGWPSSECALFICWRLFFLPLFRRHCPFFYFHVIELPLYSLRSCFLFLSKAPPPFSAALSSESRQRLWSQLASSFTHRQQQQIK